MADESPTRASWIPRDRGEIGDQFLQAHGLTDSGAFRTGVFQICLDHLPCRSGPAKPATADFSTQFFHNAARLWKLDPTSPPTYTWRRKRNVSHPGLKFSMACADGECKQDSHRHRSRIVGFCWGQHGSRRLHVRRGRAEWIWKKNCSTRLTG